MTTKEDQMLLASLEDKFHQANDQYRIVSSVFLDLRQRTVAEGFCRRQKGVRYVFYGGYSEAERVSLIFLPDYVDVKQGGEAEYFWHDGADDDPLVLLRITQNGYRELTHRDYLGSLMGLGLKREMIGDILVRQDGCDILLMKEIAEFLLYNYEKAGRVYLNTELLPPKEICIPEMRTEEKKDTVASLRLDNVVASGFSLSRAKAAEAVTSGLVFVDSLQVTKPDYIVKEAQKLVLRGKGKLVLKEILGVSKKDRTVILLEKYL